MTIETIKQMRKDKKVLKATKKVFEAKALVDVMKKKYEPINTKQLLSMMLIDTTTGEQIVETEDLYLINESARNLYYKAIRTKYKNMGMDKKYYENGICPILEAESLERELKRKLIDITSKYTGLCFDDLMYSLDKYNKWVELHLKLLVEYI